MLWYVTGWEFCYCLSIPYVLLWKFFHELLLNQDIMRFYVEALVPNVYLSCWNYSAAKFQIIWYWILKDKYLFIQFMFWEKECDIPFKLNYSDFYYEIFMLGKRGVTIGIRAGRSVRPSRLVVVSCDGWILLLCFLINGYVLLCDHVWLTNLNVILCNVWSYYFVIHCLRYLSNN
jgi:hypothetical protein